MSVSIGSSTPAYAPPATSAANGADSSEVDDLSASMTKDFMQNLMQKGDKAMKKHTETLKKAVNDPDADPEE